MLTNTLPIVGARFRPPAVIVLNSIAVGTPLFLIAEPENQYDPNAVAVWIETDNIPKASQDFLEMSLPDCGMDLEKLLAETAWHLGYIPKEMAAKLQPLLGSEQYPVTFSVNPQGAPRVRSETPFDL